jgi:class 3 adenylate cyclase
VSETRKLATILVSDVVGYSRLTGADEDRTLARLRGLRSDLIDPSIATHRGRIVKQTGDGSIIEFRSVVDAVRCAIEVQTGMVERNAGLPPERRIEFRVGVHLGDIVEESDGDLMGDGVNVAARLERICEPGAICLSEDAYRQVKSRLELQVADLGPQKLKTSPSRCALTSCARARLRRKNRPSRRRRRAVSGRAGLRWRLRLLSCFLRRAHMLGAGATRRVSWPLPLTTSSRMRHGFRSSCCRSRTSLATRSRTISPTGSPTI